MAEALNLGIPILGGISLLAAAYFALRAMGQRERARHQAYGVGRQEARQAMHVDLTRGFLFFVIALILLGVFGLSPRPTDILVAPTIPPTASPTATATMTARPSTTPTLPAPASLTPVASPTSPVLALTPTATVTPTATITPTITPTSPPTTAIVNSQVGLYLREAPGGTQELELIPYQAIVTLLPGREMAADGSEWQQVRTEAGNEGWVAVQFITYQP